ncbi:hypothetical protein FRC10_002444 [Ceratobasidium sp. 414]|nr:hypothetical protein FRC10_002444 [Ceratobasidium sp. 414]
MSSVTNTQSKPDVKRLDIFGPNGLRELLRTSLRLTHTTLSGKYAVHELLLPGDTPYQCGQSDLHPNEAAGRDLAQSGGGCWTDVENDAGWVVSAGPIKHRGYVFQESPRAAPFDSETYLEPLDRNADALVAQGIRNPRSLLGQLLRSRESISLPDDTVLHPPPLIPGRKLVVLGDTSDPWGIKDMAMDATLLVHEATNAYIPLSIDPKSPKADTEGSVTERALQRGHSTPAMAGDFARAICARSLVLNHFSSRPPDGGCDSRELEMMSFFWGATVIWSAMKGSSHEQPDAPVESDTRAAVMSEIERQASDAWGGGQAVAAYDLMSLDLGN